MDYIVIAKRYHLGTVTDAYRLRHSSRQKAIDDYIDKMENGHWTTVTAEVLKDGRHISLIETELFLFDANEQFLKA